MSDYRPAQVSLHGTPSRYTNGCRCRPCTDAHAQRAADYAKGTFAGRSEVSEWMRGLGWDRPVPRAIPKVFVERWNRENPDRPYIGKGSAS